ncbi:MAG: E3 binding domain-containing protein, partial [Thermoflexales bacterium]|nr:E3 binding domain-containing protein [Thermoflexales bacterium]
MNMTEVRMPKLGESVVEGKIARWLKQPGDTVREFEPLLEVETDKVTTEVTATVGGTLVRIVQAEGAVVAVDGVIAVIGAAGAAVAAPVAPAVHAAPAPAAPVAAGFAATPLAARASGGAWVSPVVGRMAAEHGVDLTQVPGTGEGGR